MEDEDLDDEEPEFEQIPDGSYDWENCPPDWDWIVAY
jgi:hypothetical protein